MCFGPSSIIPSASVFPLPVVQESAWEHRKKDASNTGRSLEYSHIAGRCALEIKLQAITVMEW